VAAKDIGFRQLGRDTLLAGVDDLGVRRRGCDLCDVPPFDRVTKHNTRSRR
jgi:hypothetical protein